MTQLVVLIGIIEAKDFSFDQLMVPISKLLLLTKMGDKTDLKSKMVRLAGFLSSMKGKVTNKFKLWAN